MHLESVAETLQTGDRVAKSAHNLTTQERAGGSMCRQDLRIGSRTNRTLARAAFAAAVTLVGASLRRNSAANSSSPPCGEGLGVGVVRGGTALPQPPDPPPRPSPSRNRVYAGFGHSTKRSKSATADFDWGRETRRHCHRISQCLWEVRARQRAGKGGTAFQHARRGCRPNPDRLRRSDPPPPGGPPEEGGGEFPVRRKKIPCSAPNRESSATP